MMLLIVVVEFLKRVNIDEWNYNQLNLSVQFVTLIIFLVQHIQQEVESLCVGNDLISMHSTDKQNRFSLGLDKRICI